MIQALLRQSARAQRRIAVHAVLAAIVAAVSGVALVAVAGWFLVGAAVAGLAGPLAVQAFNYLVPSAAVRGMAITRTLGRYGERWLGHRAALLTLAELRARLFALLAGAQPQALAMRSGGAAAAQLGSDVEALEDLVIRRISATGAIAGAVAAIAAALLAGILPAAILAAGLSVSLLATRALAPRLLAGPQRDHGAAVQRLKESYADYAECSVEIALYGQARRITGILADLGAAVDDARLAIARREGLIAAIHIALASVTIALMLAAGQASPPLQALTALAAAGAFDVCSGLVHSLMRRTAVDVAVARLTTLAELPQRETSANGPPDPSLAIAAQAIAPGERVRIGGASGSGKTRLLEALAGLRQDAPQRLTVGGIEVRELGLARLQGLFALSAQDAPMIAGTIADNLRLAAPGLDEAAMWHALGIACLADTVRGLPEGLETWLGAQGVRLSGGQRKRLSLARALLAGRPWLALDEPSEGLDPETERRLAANLDRWLHETGSGLLLVSHRTGLHRLTQRVVEL